MAFAQTGEATYPGAVRDDDAALRLYRLEDHGGWLVDAGGFVFEHRLYVVDGVEGAHEAVWVGHETDALQRDSRTSAMVAVSGRRQTAQGHPVIAAHEREDARTPRRLARDLECRFDRVRPRGATELHLVHVIVGREYVPIHRPEEISLGHGVEVQSVGNGVGIEVVDELTFDRRFVVPVVERTGARQKIDVTRAVRRIHEGTLGLVEDGRERPTVRAHVRLQPLEDLRIRHGVFLRLGRATTPISK